jgi:hypothetical protein
MIILIAVLTMVSDAQPTPKLVRNARASVTIARGSEISSKTWKPASRPSQREILKREKDGRTVLLRLTEHE